MNTEIKQRIYKMIFYGQVTDAEKILSGAPALSPCLLALAYSIQGKIKQAKEILDISSQNDSDVIDCMACEETEMLISVKMMTPSTLERAEKIIEAYPNAAIANYFISQDALKRKKWSVALMHYQNIARVYPDCDGLLLDIAKALFLLKKSDSALEYTKRAKISLRQVLYRILIPLGKPLPRIVMLLTIFLLLAATGFNVYVYIGLVTLIVVGFFASFRRDVLISSAFLYLGTFSTLIWFFSRWVWSLM